VEWNIVIAGVGGQGILTAEHLLAQTAMRLGYSVRAGEIHGLAQRFGSVVSFVRFGDEVWSPSVPEYAGGIMLGFEPVEALRYINYMKNGGVVLMNTKKIPPTLVSMGAASYPDWPEIEAVLEKRNMKLIKIPAEEIAISAGSHLAINTVMVGASLKLGLLPFKIEDVEDTIRDIFKEKLWELNIKALRMGYDAINA